MRKYISAMHKFGYLAILKLYTEYLDLENYEELALIEKAFEEVEEKYNFKIPRQLNERAYDEYEQHINKLGLTADIELLEDYYNQAKEYVETIQKSKINRYGRE